MIFKWFSEGFKKLLNKHKTFEKIIDEQFGKSQVLFYPLRSSKPFDIRETLKLTNLENEFLKNILWNRIITKQNSNDEKVIKIAKFVNKHLTYKTDKELHYKIEYWCNPYITFKLKSGDCDDYALLIMKFMELAGIPEWRRRIVAGDTACGGHGYVVYFSEEYGDWFVVEGSFYPRKALNEFNKKPFRFNERYYELWFSFTEKRAWSKKKKVFINSFDKYNEYQ